MIKKGKNEFENSVKSLSKFDLRYIELLNSVDAEVCFKILRISFY